jgi:hypothetical protein
MISAHRPPILHTAYQKASSFSVCFPNVLMKLALISLINKTGSTVPVTGFHG